MLSMIVLKRLLPYILGIILILGVGFWIYNSGYSSGAQEVTRQYEEKIQQERKRLQEANDVALKNAKIAEQRLKDELNDREKLILSLTEDSMSSADAADQCIGVDWVRRLNRIR